MVISKMLDRKTKKREIKNISFLEESMKLKKEGRNSPMFKEVVTSVIIEINEVIIYINITSRLSRSSLRTRVTQLKSYGGLKFCVDHSKVGLLIAQEPMLSLSIFRISLPVTYFFIYTKVYPTA